MQTIISVNDSKEIELVRREVINLLSQIEEFLLDAAEFAERHATSQK